MKIVTALMSMELNSCASAIKAGRVTATNPGLHAEVNTECHVIGAQADIAPQWSLRPKCSWFSLDLHFLLMVLGNRKDEYFCT